MFKFACFLLKFAPRWYLKLLVSGLRSLEYVPYSFVFTADVDDAFDYISRFIVTITGVLPSLIFFNNVYYNQFPELRI